MLNFTIARQSVRLAGEGLIVLMACAVIGAAQENPTATTQSAAPAAAEKTRARRITPPASENTASAKIEKSVAATVKEPNSSSGGTPATKALRDQIDAATPEEKPQLQIQLVDQLIKDGMKAEAVAELHAMIAEDRFDPTGFYNIGNRLARLDDPEGAISAYRKAIDQRKGNYSRALNNLGAIQLRAGHSDDAFNSLSAALRLEHFRYAEASYNLGRLYAMGGLTDLAIREWRRALAVDPQNAAVAQALANIGTQRIEVEKLPGSKTSVASSLPPKDGAVAKNVNRSSSPTAAAGSRPLTLDRPTYDLLQRARNARDRGRDDEAVQTYRSVLAHTGGYFAPANLELAYALITLKRNDEALAALQPVATRDGSRFPFAYYHLARIYEQRNELKLAEENFMQAAAHTIGNPQFLLDVSRVREKSGDLNGALSAFEQYVQATTQAGHKPDWSEEHLAALREKLASQASPKP